MVCHDSGVSSPYDSLPITVGKGRWFVFLILAPYVEHFHSIMDLDLDLAKRTFDYSTKNIPLHGKELYTKALISKSETFIKNLRWGTFFFLNPKIEQQDTETYGFNSTKAPSILSKLKDFENDLTKLIESIKFKHISNKFQHQLKNDIDHIKKDDHMYVPAYKTNNYYRIKPNQCEHL